MILRVHACGCTHFQADSFCGIAHMARPACIYFVHSWVDLCASKSSSAGITLDTEMHMMLMQHTRMLSKPLKPIRSNQASCIQKTLQVSRRSTMCTFVGADSSRRLLTRLSIRIVSLQVTNTPVWIHSFAYCKSSISHIERLASFRLRTNWKVIHDSQEFV